MKDVASIISPLSRGLPKTQQYIGYRVGDDGDLEIGWWCGRFYGTNKERFVLHPVYPDDIVTDRATGLMWARNGTGVGCFGGLSQTWNNAIDWANALTWCGYSDWRLPNIRELASILHCDRSEPSIDTDIFPNTNNLRTWSSTTYHYNTANARVVRWLDGVISYNPKTDSNYCRAVRGCQ